MRLRWWVIAWILSSGAAFAADRGNDIVESFATICVNAPIDMGTAEGEARVRHWHLTDEKNVPPNNLGYFLHQKTWLVPLVSGPHLLMIDEAQGPKGHVQMCSVADNDVDVKDVKPSLVQMLKLGEPLVQPTITDEASHVSQWHYGSGDSKISLIDPVPGNPRGVDLVLLQVTPPVVGSGKPNPAPVAPPHAQENIASEADTLRNICEDQFASYDGMLAAARFKHFTEVPLSQEILGDVRPSRSASWQLPLQSGNAVLTMLEGHNGNGEYVRVCGINDNTLSVHDMMNELYKKELTSATHPTEQTLKGNRVRIWTDRRLNKDPSLSIVVTDGTLRQKPGFMVAMVLRSSHDPKPAAHHRPAQ